ncbi:MAG: hypothetical protein LBH43_03045 [Treponema sp.]|jgi:hypothetical protein|nr:hypothetical protein [Treponema sp.]
MNNDFIETRIIDAVRKLLTGRVNELLGSVEYVIPFVEFSNYGGNTAVVPSIALSTCELSEKERTIRLAAYTLTITFNVPEHPDSELHSYIYSWAVCRALEQNPTLGGVADRAVVAAKKYVPPKNANCGQEWQVIITLRLTVEGYAYAG